MKSATVTFVVDGQEYPLVFKDVEGAGFTPREAGYLRRSTGLVGIVDNLNALAKTDLEVMAYLAILAMRRAGATPNEDAILDGVSTLTVKMPEAEDEAGPPAGAGDAAPAATSDTSTTPAPTGAPS